MQDIKSSTPETDLEESAQTQRFGGYVVKSSFARNLERQRDEARGQLTKLKVENDHNWQAVDDLEKMIAIARELRDALQLATDECLWRSDSQVPLSEAHSQKLYDVATTALTKAKEAGL
jgi:hypothetical protein